MWWALVMACAVPEDSAEVEGGPVCGDEVCDAGETPESCPWDCGFRYAVLTDVRADNSGSSPGVDLDAVELELQLGEPQFVQRVVDAVIVGPDNAWTDPSAVIGVPDSECEARFVSLGGLPSYIVLDFGRPIRRGDALTVYELGSRMCGSGTDDAWELSLSNTADPFDAEFLAGGYGRSTVAIDW